LVGMIDTPCPTQPVQAWVVRMSRNLGIFVRKFRAEGVSGTRISLMRRIRRLSIRLKIISWNVGNKLGIESDRPAPTLPDDFFTATVTAARHYAPKSFDVPVLLFKRTNELRGRFRLKDYGWRQILDDNVTVIDIEGYHWTLLMQPGVAVLAKKLEAAMRAAREGESGVASSAAAGY